MLLCILKTRHLEVVWQLEVCLRITLEGFKVHNERIFDCKDSVIVNVLALPVKNLRNNRLVARSGELSIGYYTVSTLCIRLSHSTYQKMYMRWPHGMSV